MSDAEFGKVIVEGVHKLVAQIVGEELDQRLPEAVARIEASPWMDVKAAAAYLNISQNALRKRVDAGLVAVHRDGAGRLRFHRDDLDQTMRRTPRRGRR